MFTPTTEFVTVMDKNIIVHQSNLILASRLNLAQDEYRTISKGNPDLDPLEFSLVHNYCIPMVVCSECTNGEMWSAEELAHIPEIESDKLFSVVKKINPHWFPDFHNNGNLSEEEKKTEIGN